MIESNRNIKINTSRLTWKDLLYAMSPALLYTALSSAVYSILVLSGCIGSNMMLQAISVTVCLAYFAWRATKEPLVLQGYKRTLYRYPAAFCYVVAVVMCGLVNNYLFLIVMGIIKELKSNYWHVTEIFYTKQLIPEIFALCILGPIVEELVYRGFVYQRLRNKISAAAAAVISAAVFGVLHFNLVQALYAFVLGILLAHIVYKTGSLLTAIAAHMAANLVSVLWTETSWLSFLNRDGIECYLAAILCLILMAIFLSYANKLSSILPKEKKH